MADELLKKSIDESRKSSSGGGDRAFTQSTLKCISDEHHHRCCAPVCILTRYLISNRFFIFSLHVGAKLYFQSAEFKRTIGLLEAH